jgi:hypothetical protein
MCRFLPFNGNQNAVDQWTFLGIEQSDTKNECVKSVHRKQLRSGEASADMGGGLRL